MKLNTFNRIIFFSLALFIAFHFTGCKRGGDCVQNTTTYNISNSDKTLVPYTGFDTLTFVRTTQGDTHTFIGTGWQHGFNISYTSDDCPQKENRESKILTFQSLSIPNSITVNQYIFSNSMYNSGLNILFQNVTYESALLGDIHDIYAHTMTIQGKVYDTVYFMSEDNIPPRPTNYGCFYTTTDGIIKMYFTNGETWELISKK